MKVQLWRPLTLCIFLTSAAMASEGEGEGEPQTKPNNSKAKAKSEIIPKLSVANLSPEELLAYVQNRLITLKDKITGFDHIYHTDGLGPQTERAQHALKNGKEDYARISYRSAIRNLNNFLNWSQVPKISDYLAAQFMLGKSYEHIREPQKASRAFSRYLATLTTNQEHFTNQAIDVIADLLRLVEKDRSRNSIELGQLMAALTSLEVPAPQKAWILFYAGKSSRIVGNDKVALFWLDRSIQETKSTRLKARARYNRSLIFIRAKEYEKAIKDLEYALEEDSEGAHDYREWAKLSLARVYVHLKKPQIALSYYGDIDRDAEAYLDGLFEMIYLNLAIKKPEEAIISATEYLIRFPHSTNAHQVRTIKAYLDLSANDLIGAKNTIDLGTSRLQAISQWLRDNYGDRDTLTLRDISGIMRVTHPEVPHPPLILYGRKLYQRLNELNQRTANLRNDLRHTIFTFGRINTNKLNPTWQRRMDQLRQLLDHTLEAGDALSQAEGGLYQKQLSEQDVYILKSSHYRRQRGLSATAAFNRQKGPWKEWSSLGDFTQRAAQRFRQIKSMQATLANLLLLTETVKVRRPTARKSELIELRTQTDLMESELLRALEVTRSRQAMTAIAMSDLMPLKHLLKDQAASFFAEASVLKEYRDVYKTPQQQHISSDLNETWGLWQHVLENLYEQVIILERDMRRTVSQRLSHFDQLIATHDELLQNLDSTNTRLSRTLGSNLGRILGHYQGQIRERMSKNKKWLADIKWLTFEKTNLEKSKSMEKYQLEQQILKENLKDLEQGVLWQWP